MARMAMKTAFDPSRALPHSWFDMSRRFRMFLVPAIYATMAWTRSAIAEVPTGLGRYWLPTVRSVHGREIDSLFLWIFCFAVTVFVIVQISLIVFLIKYRARPDRKAYYTHGGARLEIVWTVIPAIICVAIALGSKHVWDRYRYSPIGENPSRAKVLVIGQQFKWNVIYPGPDGKFGRYLAFPRPTDGHWPLDQDGQLPRVAGVSGPAELPYKQALSAISMYIDTVNPLGKDFSDPDGKDDDFMNALGRAVVVPIGRPVEIRLMSKDVIHDFFLPNFRVKLDAVPGMTGRVFLEATTTSFERAKASARTIKLDDLERLLATPGGKKLTIQIDEASPGTEHNKKRDDLAWRYVNPATPNSPIMRNAGEFQVDANRRKAQINALKEIGLTEIIISDSGAWEVVCEELCGAGHNTMTAQFIVVSQEEYDQKKWDSSTATRPTTIQSRTIPPSK